MKTEALINASRLISARNVNSRVKSVKVAWDESTRKLTVAYDVDGEPSDEEREFCELSMGELLAEFPEVKIADTICDAAEVEESVDSGWQIVYTKK